MARVGRWDIQLTECCTKDKKKATKKTGKGVKEEPIVVEVAPAEPEPAPIVDDFEGWGTSKKVSTAESFSSHVQFLRSFRVVLTEFSKGQKEKEECFRLGCRSGPNC